MLWYSAITHQWDLLGYIAIAFVLLLESCITLKSNPEFHFGFSRRIIILDFMDEKPKRDRMLFGIFILDFLGDKSFLYGY